jgi:hypothetical protein
LKWIEKEKIFDFWKSEVEKHIVESIDKIELNLFIDNYAYVASEWKAKDDSIIILLEKIH